MAFKLRHQSPLCQVIDPSKIINSSKAIESTSVNKPKVLPIKTDIEKEATKQSLMKEKFGDIKQYNPQSKISKITDIALNPLTAAGYAARNESIPNNFSKGPRNALDNALDIINPSFYAKKTVSAIVNNASGISNIAKGKLPSAVRDFKNAAMDALDILPVASEVKGSVKLAKHINNTEKEISFIKNIGSNDVSSPFDKPISELKKYGKVTKEPVKDTGKTIHILTNPDEVSRENDHYEKMKALKVRANDEVQLYKNRHRSEFKSLFGDRYHEHDVELFGRMRETHKNKIDPLVDFNLTSHEEYKPFISKSYVDRNKIISDEFQAKHNISKDYTPEEELLNHSYGYRYDSNINARKSKALPDTNTKFYSKDVAPKLESLVKRNKLQSPEELHRGENNYTVKHVWREGVKLPTGSVAFADLKKGDIYKPGSFVSTSLDKNMAKSFGNITSQIEAPKGQSIMHSNSIKGGEFKGEKEILLPSKLKFKIESRRITGKSTSKGPKVNFKQSIVNPYTVAGAIGGGIMFSGNKNK